MSKYTTELRFICEDAYGLKGDEKVRPSINEITSSSKVRNSIFDFPYPIFDESYRPVLEQKILKRYYTREIGEETVELWKLRLDTRLNEIMPYYNKLYASELIEFNPLYNTNYTKESNRDGKVLTDNSEDKTYSELTDTDNTEVRTPELKDKTTLDLNDLKTLDLNDLKTLNLKDLETLNLNDLKTLNLNDLKTLNLSDLKTLNLTDEETLALNELKTLNLKDRTTKNLTTDFDGSENTSSNEVTRKTSGTWDLYSDTPQGGVAGIENAQTDPSVVTNGYLTNARHTFNDGSPDTVTGTRGVTTDNQTRETGTSDLDKTGTENLAKTGTDTTDHTGTETLAKTGTDSLDRTGTENLARTGTDTLEKTGTESTDKTGTENLDRTGTETLDRTGKETVKFDGNVDRNGTAKTIFDGEKNSTEDYLEKVVGWNGSNPNKFLEDYRNNFLNIDRDIVNSLKDLFMNIW